MLGNEIVVSELARGRREEGIINGGLKPGTVIQVVSGSTLDAGNRLTWEAYNKTASGTPAKIAILDYNSDLGKTADDAIPTGTRGSIYYPMIGDDLNMLIQDQSGTGATSDFSVGDPLMVEDGTGLLIDGVLGTNECPFECQENVTDMTADTRLHVKFTGV